MLYETNLRTYSINQQAYIFAQDVNIDVISAVKERRLTGVTIETTTVRQYNTVAAATCWAMWETSSPATGTTTGSRATA